MTRQHPKAAVGLFGLHLAVTEHRGLFTKASELLPWHPVDIYVVAGDVDLVDEAHGAPPECLWAATVDAERPSWRPRTSWRLMHSITCRHIVHRFLEIGLGAPHPRQPEVALGDV